MKRVETMVVSSRCEMVKGSVRLVGYMSVFEPSRLDGSACLGDLRRLFLHKGTFCGEVVVDNDTHPKGLPCLRLFTKAMQASAERTFDRP